MDFEPCFSRRVRTTTNKFLLGQRRIRTLPTPVRRETAQRRRRPSEECHNVYQISINYGADDGLHLPDRVHIKSFG